ncbi:MAG: prepilin peptidase [Candidatus Woesearchaeota archaeon]
MIDFAIFGVTFIGLLVGSITDIQRREVPDWISYGMVFAGLGLRFLHSVVTGEWLYFLWGLLGFGILFGLAYLMFYTGQWGGGDSKLLIAMGALMATFPAFLNDWFNPFFAGFPFLIAFWINLLIVGAIYAIFWSIIVGMIHRKEFAKTMKKKLSGKLMTRIRHIIYAISTICLVAAFAVQIIFIRIVLAVAGIFILLTYFAWVSIKAVEESCMYKKVLPKELTEGDWIVKDIVIDGKFICGPRTLGVEEKHIRKLKEFYKQDKVQKILIKTGIPFIPSFFVAFIVTCIWGNFVVGMIL